jgi:hypothetical protein
VVKREDGGDSEQSGDGPADGAAPPRSSQRRSREQIAPEKLSVGRCGLLLQSLRYARFHTFRRGSVLDGGEGFVDRGVGLVGLNLHKISYPRG